VRRTLAALAALLLCAARPAPAPSPTPDAEAERLFAAARDAFSAANYPRFATYTVGISYERGGRRYAFHYDTYEDLRRNLVYARAFSSEEEAHPKVPTGTNISALSVNGQGGIVANADHADDPVGTLALGINQRYRLERSEDTIKALQDASAAANALSLPVIGRSGNAARDYDVRLADVVTANGTTVAHLTLEPRRDPHQYIVRDLWIDKDHATILRARVAENFNAGPLRDVAWIVRYVQIDGAPYIESETAEADVTYEDDEVLKNVTITFSNMKALGALPWRYGVGFEPHPAVTDP
jgi:hypothetical protein